METYIYQSSTNRSSDPKTRKITLFSHHSASLFLNSTCNHLVCRRTWMIGCPMEFHRTIRVLNILNQEALPYVTAFFSQPSPKLSNQFILSKPEISLNDSTKSITISNLITGFSLDSCPLPSILKHVQSTKDNLWINRNPLVYMAHPVQTGKNGIDPNQIKREIWE